MGCGNSNENKQDKQETKKEEDQQEKYSNGGQAPLRHLLPQHQLGETKDQRVMKISQRQEEYQWEFSENLPPVLKELPDDEKTLAVGGQFIDMFGPDGSTPKMKIIEAIDALKDKFTRGDSDPFEDYTKVYPGELEGLRWTVRIPRIAEKNRWKEDKEFGRQRLGGMNPVGCKRLKDGLESIKERFPITDDMVEGLTDGKTLAELDAAGKLYYTDYSEMEGIQNFDQLNGTVYIPYCLFFTNSEGDMMPLGVQMYQDPKVSPIFTPKNTCPELWLLVKICVQQMEASYQIIREHLGGMHFFAETFYVSCRRRLHDDHPVFQLMQDSFWATLPVNVSGRILLMEPEGRVPKDFVQGGEGMWTLLKRSLVDEPDFNRWVFKEDIADRGMEDCPKYYWRDDSQAGWECWEKYVGKFIDSIYLDDDDLLKDVEVQNWAEEFSTITNYKNLPVTNKQFKTKDQFKFFLTTIMWNVTFKHMSIHMTQFEMMAFIPNAPATLRKALPMDADYKLTEKEIREEFLPEWDSMIDQIGFFAGVVYPPNPGYALGEFTEKFVPKGTPGHDHNQMLIKEFNDDLKALSAKIKKRNEGIEVPYSYIDPENMWRSICV